MAQKCDVIWPEKECRNPIVRPTFPPRTSSDHTIAAKVVPKCKIVQYVINQSVWESIKGTVNSSMYTGVQVKTDLAAGKVYLVGQSKRVTEINPSFRNLVEETNRQVEKKNQSLTVVVAKPPVNKSGLEKKMTKQASELKIDNNLQTKEVQKSGPRYDDLTARRKMYNFQEQMKSRCVPVNPHLVKFLRLTGHKKLTDLLFARHNIKALLKIDGNVVKLTAYSEEDLKKAEEQIKEGLACRCIFVEEQSLLESPEWKSLLSQVKKTLNVEMRTVQILEFPSEAEKDVVITGLTSNVQECQKKVRDFLKNATIKRAVHIKSRVMIQFIQDKRRAIWKRIPKKVKVKNKGDRMFLSGPWVQVQEAELLIKNFQSSLHCDSLHINKPGVKKFCAINEKVHIATAKEEFNCAVHLEKAGRKDFVLGDPRFQVKLPKGLTISIYKGDLCRHNVDVIVNAANERLQHIGGLAKAIVTAAGPKLKDDCDSKIKTIGELSAGDSIITNAGNLPCKQVIHTVGPRWSKSSRLRCESLLRKAITASLQLASEYNHRSIGIPAVSSGIFAFPLDLCIENIVEAVRVYVESQQTTLQQIHFLDINEETVKMFCEVTKAKFGNQANNALPKAPAITQDVKVEDSEVQVIGGSENFVKTKEGMIIKLLQKNIEDCGTDVIVNSLIPSRNQKIGVISNALLSRAGLQLQQLLNDAHSGTKPSPGSIFSTSACNLNCQEVLHVVAPAWDSGQEASKKTLCGIVKNCLTMADRSQRKSISFPAFKAGLGFPKTLVASVMFDEIFQFSSRKNMQNLQEVHLVLHPGDSETIKAFSSQLAKYAGFTTNKAAIRRPAGPRSNFFGAVTSPSKGVHEMTVGSVTYQVKVGDITKEKAEVIVNSSNPNFTLRAGVSKAILEAAGADVEVSAKNLGLKLKKELIMTQAGNLKHCKWILHVAGANHPDSIKRLVLDALQECAKHRVTSVAFPALGTGGAGLRALAAADSLLDAVVDFTKSKPVGSLKMVKVILSQEIMLNDFYKSMKKREENAKTKPEPAFPEVTESAMTQEKDSVTFSLCASEKEDLNKTKIWLQQQIDSAQAEKVITEECVSEIEEADMQKISDLQKKFQVSVIYKPPDPSIRIVGLTQDVMAVSGEIEVIINRIKEYKSGERAAEVIGKLVEWRYKDGDKMVAFNKMANLELEEAKNGNKTEITIQSPGNHITANLDKETAIDKQGNQVRIQRVIKHEEDFHQVPEHWKPMEYTPVMEEDVQSGTSEYSAVEQKFKESCQDKILKILRVQNRTLFLNYQLKKHDVDTRNGPIDNEKKLFHGTDSKSIKHINHHGFNRSYAGKNAVAYGNGTYFAVSASYSAQNTYSKPDESGQKHMYLARVLTGVYGAGKPGMVVPPAKNPANAFDLYDSVTDNLTHPALFVIFNDIQAYPEYHIIFQQ